MRFIRRIPSTDKELSDKLISEGWTKLKEPSNLSIATLLSVPFMFINGGISMSISYILYAPMKEIFNSKHGFNFSFTVNLYTLIYVFGIFVFMAIHEICHACFIPNVLNSNKTYWGINGFFGFVYTTEKMKKGRFLLISIMPFILLSLFYLLY